MKISLDKKILIGFIICSGILVAVAFISLRNSRQFIETNQLVNHTHEVLFELEQILVSTINAETGARGFVITGKESYLEPLDSAKLSVHRHIERTRQMTRSNAEVQRILGQVEKLIVKRFADLEKYSQLRKTTSFEEAKAIVDSGRGKELQDQIRVLINNAERIERNLLAERRQASEEDATSFNVFFIILLAFIVATLLILYVIITTNLKALRKAERDAADKNWSLTGSAELIKSMQGNKQVRELTQVIINHLAAYLNAQVGAIYVVEENTLNLRMESTYAFDKRKSSSPVIRFGEGIVGQSAAEKRMILMTDIPKDYFNIGTGFGEILPKNIIAIPFVFENKVAIGVIELGSIYSFTEQQKQYLKLVVDSISIAVTSSKIREKTKELLEETQRQAEELEVQQEELKQANEELYAKTESLESSASKLEAQQEELQEVNVELEEKATILEEQKERLENAKAEIENKAGEIELTSKYKSEFLANMSHELRTPLNSILILAQLLSENKHNTLGEKDVEYARNIHHSGSDLLDLINEILDLSKVEAGKMRLDLAEVPLQNIFNNISSVFSEVAKNKSIDFKINCSEEVRQSSIRTDQQHVEQILKNLLSNAFKFTAKKGKVVLTIGPPSADIHFKNNCLTPLTNVVAFSVSDTGIGIPIEKQGIVFEAFQQADGSTKRKYGGTGLGLSISRELAGILAGEIHLESEEGKGSTFTLYLPMKFDPSSIAFTDKQVEIKENGFRKKEVIKVVHQLPVSEKMTVFDDRKNLGENDRIILIIEDEEKFAQVLLDFIRERKYKGIIAHEGNTGISYARHYKPDAILLDMKLPVMDGMEVLKQIKNDPDLRHIPVQIISSYDQKKEVLEIGAFDYLQKPVTIIDLQNVFDRIEKFTSKKLKKLLIVEDNKEQNTAIRELIGNDDVKCFSAYLGAEAYAMLNKDTFDCIIVDLGLPDMSGFELLEKIKASKILNKIPIIVYTGRDLKKDDNDRLNKLADTVVLKTVDSKERLLDETILFLHSVEAKLPKEKQRIIRTLHKADEILKNKVILLVDDDVRNIYSLTNALEEEGLRCITAENGKIALTALKENPFIDLVLMDVMMPEMDGYETTTEIRKLSEFKNLPIIALTAKAMKGDKEKCLAVGMSDYISKPVHIEQLLSLIRVWLYR